MNLQNFIFVLLVVFHRSVKKALQLIKSPVDL